VAKREATIWTVAVVWLATVGGGFWLWERYDTTPGRTGAPTVAAGEPLRDRWRLTAYMHPQCPCSRATLHELAELARGAPELFVRVVFVLPTGDFEDGEQGESWDMAVSIPNAVVTCELGKSAHVFGAETSGFVVLTDPDGGVVFRGGLTPARGRTGESAGRRAILAWLGSGNGALTAPVFGCPLFTPDD
jgi:hypothetical protein